MNNILVLGAGRSATVMIDYLLKNAKTENWNVKIADINVEHLAPKLKEYGTGEALVIDITIPEVREKYISEANIACHCLVN